ncbi:TPX2 family protein, putative isoform 1 [Hibiscus syriacus]|uniref:TPX2 family protein, putative isoform 1 n=1 Tax=Hibiscus syriacus TaxID=106335 RepID=A0A6A3BYR1_HIBSY|nr:TPX2 family protein, putative isoform 1 [Hibiscus syriacus]
MHINDLRVLAPLWLSKTEEVREDRAHWSMNITGDIYGTGWISEMHGHPFGAAEAGLRHKINDHMVIYPGYTPRSCVEPILLHYGLPFSVGNLSFSRLQHHEDDIVYERESYGVGSIKGPGLYLSIECIKTMNEALPLQCARHECLKSDAVSTSHKQ